MEPYTYILILLIPIMIILWRYYKLSNYVDKLEASLFIILDQLDGDLKKEEISKWFKKTNVYKEMIKNRKNN